MKTKILAFLVIISFVFFSCAKNENSSSSSDSASLLKSATIATSDAVVQSASVEANIRGRLLCRV